MSIPTSHIKRPYYNQRKNLFWFSKIHGYIAFARTVHLANNRGVRVVNRPQMDAFWLRELVRLYERVLAVSKEKAVLDDVRKEQRKAVRLLSGGMTTRWTKEVNRYWERKAIENPGLNIMCHTDESCFYKKLETGDRENVMDDGMDLDATIEGQDVAVDVDNKERKTVPPIVLCTSKCPTFFREDGDRL